VRESGELGAGFQCIDMWVPLITIIVCFTQPFPASSSLADVSILFHCWSQIALDLLFALSFRSPLSLFQPDGNGFANDR
jgi:hypothetical protein